MNKEKTTKILIAPDSFKGTIEAKKVCKIIEKAFKKRLKNVDIISIPLSDGGEGLVDILQGSDFKEKEALVLDALGEKIKAKYLMKDKTAIIEMASVVGLDMLENEQKNPMQTNTFGVGQLILSALDNGAKEFIIGIGGSSTNDGGFAMLQAFGVEFYDLNNQIIKGLNINELEKVSKISIDNIDKRLENISFKVACDVKNTLSGENGASYIFGKQKGANLEQIKQLDLALSNLAKVTKSSLGIDVANIEGAGAGGGIGFALLAFLGAELESGIDLIMNLSGFSNQLKDVDLIITGEGKTDSQTLNGKVVFGVAKKAKQFNKKMIVISGCLEKGYEPLYELGVSSVFSSVSAVDSLENILENAEQNLFDISFSVAGIIEN